MRILHLAWEYPPVMYGGLGRHVHALAHAQARAGHDVVVLTQSPEHSADHPELADDGDVHVLRAPTGPRPEGLDGLLAHVAAMEGWFTGCGAELLERWSPDVIHAHDWMVAHAGVALRERAAAPLVATIHASEAGRNGGWVSTSLSTNIHAVEWWLANTADAVIACSRAMADEVHELFGVAPRVVVNGIDPAQWRRPTDTTARIRSEHADADPLLAYTGRLEFEKGVQTLLSAMPELRARHPRIRLLVAGQGSQQPALQAHAASLGLNGSVRFLGWVSEEELRGIVAAADLAVAPSLYEPFGLVALEAAALGTPIVVAETGGLAEFARHGQRAATFTPGNAPELVAVVDAALDDPDACAARARRAERAIAVEHDWDRLAGQTVEVYGEALDAYTACSIPDDSRHDACAARQAIPAPVAAEPPGLLLRRGA